MQIEALKLVPVVSSVSSSIGADTTADVKIEGKSFGQYFDEALTNVNALQKKSQEATMNMAAGRVEDLSQVVVAAEKASIALQLTMQVRNKALDAYQEIMRMQV